MTDIVERLRAAEAARRKSFTNALIDRDWLTEAADEIVRLRDRTTCLSGDIYRLRAQVVSLQSSLDAGPPKPGKKTPDAMEKPE